MPCTSKVAHHIGVQLRERASVGSGRVLRQIALLRRRGRRMQTTGDRASALVGGHGIYRRQTHAQPGHAVAVGLDRHEALCSGGTMTLGHGLTLERLGQAASQIAQSRRRHRPIDHALQQHLLDLTAPVFVEAAELGVERLGVLTPEIASLPGVEGVGQLTLQALGQIHEPRYRALGPAQARADVCVDSAQVDTRVDTMLPRRID